MYFQYDFSITNNIVCMFTTIKYIYYYLPLLICVFFIYPTTNMVLIVCVTSSNSLFEHNTLFKTRYNAIERVPKEVVTAIYVFNYFSIK